MPFHLMSPLHNRLILKTLVIIVVVTCGYLIGSSWKEKNEKIEPVTTVRSEHHNLTLDLTDPTAAYVDIGEGVVQMSRFNKENFSYVEEEEDEKYNVKSYNCFVDDWNKVHTDTLPLAQLHSKWMKNNISRNNYLYHTTPSPLAAFVHEQQIVVTLTAENMFGKTVYCRYFDCNRREIPEVFQSVVYPESTVYCGRRVGAKYISISESIDDKPEPPVPLQSRITKGLQHYFTVCMATLYGEEPKFVQIVDFIEYHKLQGATFFHIYLRNASAYDRILLDDYVRTGEIELIVLNDHYWRADFMWHMMQINDCHMRSQNFSKWTAFLDIDERIEMKKDWRIVDFLDTITNPNINNLQISVQWVLKDEWSPTKFEHDQQFTENLVFKRFHNSSRVGDYWIQPKSIIRPDRVGAMTIHVPLAVYKGFIKTYLNATIGVVRHYRNVDGGALVNNNKRAFNMGPYSRTDINPNVEEKLTEACLSRVKMIYDTVNYSCEKMQEMYHVHGLTHDCYRKQLAEKRLAEMKDQQILI